MYKLTGGGFLEAQATGSEEGQLGAFALAGSRHLSRLPLLAVTKAEAPAFVNGRLPPSQ